MMSASPFAVSTLIDAHRQGCDVDERIAVLATHLGHVTPSNTYWYLTVTPALADAVSERTALYYQGGISR
jgi:integrase/recombinase XerD